MFGAVADDFTGATDLAGNWRSRGLKTAVYRGVPSPDDYEKLREYDAIVLALKIRSVDSAEAKALSFKAGQVLLDLGCEQIYDKYCSTFDSTSEGNIGPIADVLFELTNSKRAVVVPSFPDAGRTVYNGHLFVLGELLDESPMKDHPLNPMRDSSIVRLLESQTQRPVGLVPLEIVHEGEEALRAELDRLQESVDYVVVDAIANEDLRIIASATSNDALVTGGSGIALGLPERQQQLSGIQEVPGERVVLCGSASAMTRRQVQHAKGSLPSRKVSPEEVMQSINETVDDYVEWVESCWQEEPGVAPLIYTVEDASDIERSKTLDEVASQDFERFFGELATRLVESGARQFIIGGGETSGAVCNSLNIQLLELGDKISPGVSWILGENGKSRLNMILKSGNFGTENLFTSAWGKLNG